METAKENASVANYAAPTAEDPAECVTDKGYHSRAVLKALDNGPWKTRIAEPKQKGFARWRGDEAARRAVTNNLLSGVAKEAFKLRAEIVERSITTSIAAACAGPGFGAARTCTSDTCSTSPATTYRC